MSKQRRLHEPSSLMWSHQWKVQGGREGWSRGWVSGIRGEKRDGKHSRNLCMGAYYMIAESLLTYCEDLLYRVSPKSS